MKISYDPSVDMMLIEFNEHYPLNTDTETLPGFAIMYDEQGKVCAIEIEDASQIVPAPNRVDFEYFTSDSGDVEEIASVGDAAQSD